MVMIPLKLPVDAVSPMLRAEAPSCYLLDIWVFLKLGGPLSKSIGFSNQE